MNITTPPIYIRSSWIDSCRALAILLVVYRHVYGFTFECSQFADKTIIGTIFPLLALPLFFFISGFLSFKHPAYWQTNSNYFLKLKQRAIKLIIPTIVFYFLLTEFVIQLPFPGGYWFTLVLFEMYLILYSFEILLNRLNCFIHDSLLVFLAVLMFLAKSIANSLNIPFLELQNLCEYFIYFILGYMFGKYKDRIFHETRVQKIITISIILLVASFCFTFHGLLSTAFIQVKRCLIVILAVTLFYNSQDFFDSSAPFPSILRFIGKRTLDIYMIHYFFLWPSVGFLSDILKETHNQPLEILIIGCWTILVIFLTLITIKILRHSKFISKYLFAA